MSILGNIRTNSFSHDKGADAGQESGAARKRREFQNTLPLKAGRILRLADGNSVGTGLSC